MSLSFSKGSAGDSREEVPTELEVHVKVLLVEGLETRVQQAREGGGCALLDDLGTGSLGVVVGAEGRKSVDVHRVVGLQLVGTE